MNIHALYLYPVKSLAGIAVNSFSLDDFGPACDRRWMIVDDEYRFVTQRSIPALANVTTGFYNKQVVISIPGEGDFTILPGKTIREVEVWGDRVQATIGAQEAAQALSRFCGKNVHLVYMSDEFFRRVDPDRVPEYRRVSFADGFPLLVTNRASLDELNTRLDRPVAMERFRPNVVIEGARPWAEDEWDRLVVGELSISLVKPCSRCIVTTVDPETGVRAADGQPLKTLTGYRRRPEGVIFGKNGVHSGSGKLSVGDTVEPSSDSEKHL